MNSLEETEKKEIGEKEIMVEEYEKTRNDVVVRVVKRETLDTRKDIELGERTVHANGKVIHYIIYGHVNKDKSETYYLYFFLVKEGIKEIFRVVNKNTAIYMLARLKLSEEQERRVKEHIPNFEIERERIQLHDRLTDNEQILTDEDIEKQIDTVQRFHYFGQQGECRRAYPHIPHIIGSYSTVRYGNLPVFCTGRSGTLLMKNGKKVQLLKTESCHDGSCSGKYMFWEIF